MSKVLGKVAVAAGAIAIAATGIGAIAGAPLMLTGGLSVASAATITATPMTAPIELHAARPQERTYVESATNDWHDSGCGSPELCDTGLGAGHRSISCDNLHGGDSRLADCNPDDGGGGTTRPHQEFGR